MIIYLVTSFDFILCIFSVKNFLLKTCLCFAIRNDTIYYGLNETNKTYNTTHVGGCFASQLALESFPPLP